MKNPVAKHMNAYNRSSVVPNKRNKMLDELYEKEQYMEVSEVTDTDRLQWFADTNGMLVIRRQPDGSGYVIWDQSFGLCLAGKGDTIQQAIDKAMTYKTGEWND